jgi:hypothetical protein
LCHIQGLKGTAEQNKLANDASYRSWVESYTPEEIAEANRARSRLKRAFKASNRGPIHDDRQPKRAVSPYILFTKTRWQSGDYAGRMPADAAKSISGEWKSLSEAEKKVRSDAFGLLLQSDSVPLTYQKLPSHTSTLEKQTLRDTSKSSSPCLAALFDGGQPSRPDLPVSSSRTQCLAKCR